MRRRDLLVGLGAVALAPGLARASDHRWVSLGGAITEILFALGMERRLVGVDASSTWPAQASQLPQLGYYRQIAAEGVLALRPTRIFTTEEAGPETALSQIEAAGVPIRRFATARDPAGAVQRILDLGAEAGSASQAASLAAGVRQGFEQAATAARAMPRRPRVLFVLSRGPGLATVAGEGTAAAAMIALAGGENALTGFQGYRSLTPEAAVVAAPEVVLCTTSGLEALGGEAAIWALPGLSLTPAGQKKRLILREELGLLGFGPRSGQEALVLATALSAVVG